MSAAAGTWHQHWIHRCRVLERPGAGPTVLFAHGVDATAAWWDLVISELDLQAGDHHLIAVDLPGHGTSDPAPGALTVQALAAALAAIAQRLSSGPIVLVGHSAGASAALLAAAALPASVRAVICVEGGVPDLRARYGDQWEQARERLQGEVYGGVPDHILRGWVRRAVGEHAVPAVLEGYTLDAEKRWWPRLAPAPRLTLLRSAYLLDGVTLARWAPCPVLVLIAQRPDGEPPTATAARQLDQVRRHQVRIDWVPGGHRLPLEAPEKVASAIASMIRPRAELTR